MALSVSASGYDLPSQEEIMGLIVSQIPAFKTDCPNPHALLEKHLGQNLKNMVYIEDEGVCIAPILYNTSSVYDFTNNLYKGIILEGYNFALLEEYFEPCIDPIHVKVVANTSSNHMKLMIKEMYGHELTVNFINRTMLDEDNAVYKLEICPIIYSYHSNIISAMFRRKKNVVYKGWSFVQV